MKKNMLIDAAHPEEVRVCVLENGKVEDFDFEHAARKPLRGNIYLARVTRVEPSLQAAFVEFGGNRHGFLAFNEIHPDYYQIPVSDRRLLQEAEAEEAKLAAELQLGGREGVDEEFDLDGGEARFADLTGGADDDDETPPSPEAAPAANRERDEDSGPAAEDGDDFSDASVQDAGEDDAEEAPSRGAAALSAEPLESLSAETATSSDAEDDAVDDDVDGESDEASAEDEDASEETEETSPAHAEKRSPARRAELLERYKQARRKRAQLLRNYKIQEVVKRRQILLVQAVKEERGSKGAALTTYLSLAGRYCVLMPNTARGGGISRKIPLASDRKRLRRVVDSLDLPQGMGLIIRTAGAKRTKAEIKRDYDYLIRLWENIRALTLKSIAPCLIYEEASLIKRAIRDLYDKDIDQILVEGDAGYREAKDFMKMLMPSHARNVQPYKDKTPLFLRYDVESQLDAMFQPTVRLKSGGYLVIHQTEALVAIDVNSGKSTRERNIEQTALKTNLEAAREAARQCRLRDLAGLIVIDFIDMEENRNNRAVEKRLKEALKSDRARIQVGRISNFGLLEMSRQRRRSGIVEGTTHSCPTCGGAGVVRSDETAALRILRAIESAAIAERAALITVRAATDVTLYILNYKRAWLRRIEEDYALTVEFIADEKKAGDQYELERRGAARALPEAPRVEATGALVEREPEEEDADADAEEREAPEARAEGEADSRRRRRRRRRGRRDDAAPGAQSSSPAFVEAESEPDEPHEEGEEKETTLAEDADAPKRRRRRGRRGGRRNRRDQEDGAEAGAESADLADAPQPEIAADRLAAEDDEPSADRPAANAFAVSEDEDPRDTVSPEAPDTQSTPQEPPKFRDEDLTPAAAATGDDEVPADALAGHDKPARKGWWQRAMGG